MQNLDRLVSRTPSVHVVRICHVEINRVTPGERPAVIIDAINLSGRNQTERRAHRPASPIGRRAADFRRLFRDGDRVLCFAHRFGFAAVLRGLDRHCRSCFFERERLQRRVGYTPHVNVVGFRDWNGARHIFGAMNRGAGRLELTAERIVIRILGVVSFRVRVGGRVHILKIALRYRRLVSGESPRSGGSRFASREKDCAKRRERGEKDFLEISAGQLRSPKSY